MSVEYKPLLWRRIRDEAEDFWQGAKNGFADWMAARWLRRNSLTNAELKEMVLKQHENDDEW